MERRVLAPITQQGNKTRAVPRSRSSACDEPIETAAAKKLRTEGKRCPGEAKVAMASISSTEHLKPEAFKGLAAPFLRACAMTSSSNVSALLDTLENDPELLLRATKIAAEVIRRRDPRFSMLKFFWTVIDPKNSYANTSAIETLVASMIIVCDPRCGLETYEFTPIVGCNPLMLAVSAGRADIVEFLLALGAKLNHAGNCTLSFAVRTGNLPMVRLLIAYGADVVNPDVMHIAVHARRVEVVRELSLYGAPVDKRGEDNWQGGEPLHFVAQYMDWDVERNLEVMHFLISEGASVSARDDNNATPLHIAAQCGWTAAIEALISRGADVNAKYKGKDTPLHLAASNLQGHAVEMLVAMGATIHKRDFEALLAASGCK